MRSMMATKCLAGALAVLTVPAFSFAQTYTGADTGRSAGTSSSLYGNEAGVRTPSQSQSNLNRNRFGETQSGSSIRSSNNLGAQSRGTNTGIKNRENLRSNTRATGMSRGGGPSASGRLNGSRAMRNTSATPRSSSRLYENNGRRARIRGEVSSSRGGGPSSMYHGNRVTSSRLNRETGVRQGISSRRGGGPVANTGLQSETHRNRIQSSSSLSRTNRAGGTATLKHRNSGNSNMMYKHYYRVRRGYHVYGGGPVVVVRHRHHRWY